jgi:hypothetical protein
MLTRYRFPLAVSTAAYKGGACGFETATNSNEGKIVPMAGGSATLVHVGNFAENVASSASAQNVNVDLGAEVQAYWYANAGAPNAVASTDLGKVCYFADDYTVSISGSSNSLAGRIWAVDSVKGVLVGKLAGTQTVTSSQIAAGGVTPGTAYQVLRTNSGATASEWGLVKPATVENGTANQILRTNSGGTASEWGTVPGVSMTPGTAYQVVRTNSGATASEWGDVRSNMVHPGTAYQVLRTNSGATASEWGPDAEAYGEIDATDNTAIVVADGRSFQITASGSGKNITVNTTGARAGNIIHICRKAIGSSTACNIVNGGTGAGTLMAMTSNKTAGCTLMFDGTDWILVSNYQGA